MKSIRRKQPWMSHFGLLRTTISIFVLLVCAVLGAPLEGPKDRARWLNGIKASADNFHRASMPISQAHLKDVVIYSALLDPISNDLQVFIEVAPHIPDSAILSCSATLHTGALVEMAATFTMFQVRNASYPLWRPMKIHCANPPEGIEDTVITLDLVVDGRSKVAPTVKNILVEAIPTELKSPIGACIVPMFTTTPTLFDWMFHNVRLGVEDFHVYIPHGGFIEREDYARDHWASFPARSARSSKPFEPFHSNLLHWYHYAPRRTSYYFGQQIMVNECVFRNRHRHSYVMLLDVDEFISLQTGSLQQLLDQVLPGKAESVVFPIEWHQVNCSRSHITYQGYDVFSMPGARPDYKALELMEPDVYHGSKTIVRPKDLNLLHVHGPLQSKSSLQLSKQVDRNIATLKHVRCGTWTA